MFVNIVRFIILFINGNIRLILTQNTPLFKVSQKITIQGVYANCRNRYFSRSCGDLSQP